MSDLTLSKLETRIFNIFKYGFMLFVLILFLSSEPWRERGCYLNENSLLERKFNGEVVRKFIDKSNHSAEVIELDSGERVYLIYEHHYESINIGDHVHKNSGSFKLEVRKTDTLLIFNHKMHCDEAGALSYPI